MRQIVSYVMINDPSKPLKGDHDYNQVFDLNIINENKKHSCPLTLAYWKPDASDLCAVLGIRVSCSAEYREVMEAI